MKRNRFTEEQIIGILKEHEAGVSVTDLCRITTPSSRIGWRVSILITLPLSSVGKSRLERHRLIDADIVAAHGRSRPRCNRCESSRCIVSCQCASLAKCFASLAATGSVHDPREIADREHLGDNTRRGCAAGDDGAPSYC
ncbi:hypothetical protein ABIA85_007428 [Bradyrhizobium sp. LA6.10]